MQGNYQLIVPRQKHSIVEVETQVEVWEKEKCC